MDNHFKCGKSSDKMHQKRSGITAETCRLDDKPNFNDIKELAEVQCQCRSSNQADFHLSSGPGYHMTHFVPIIVSDNKPGTLTAARSPTIENAKAVARAALKAKLDLKIPKKENNLLLEDLENDALNSPLVMLTDLEQHKLSRRHATCDTTGLPKNISTASDASLPADVTARYFRKLFITSNSSNVETTRPSCKASSTASDSVFCQVTKTPNCSCIDSDDHSNSASLKNLKIQKSSDVESDEATTSVVPERLEKVTLEQKVLITDLGQENNDCQAAFSVQDDLPSTPQFGIIFRPLTASDKSISPIKHPKNTGTVDVPHRPLMVNSCISQKEQSTGMEAFDNLPCAVKPVVKRPSESQLNTVLFVGNQITANSQPVITPDSPKNTSPPVTENQTIIESSFSLMVPDVSNAKCEMSMFPTGGQLMWPTPVRQCTGIFDQMSASQNNQLMPQLSPSQHMQVIDQMSPVQFGGQHQFHQSGVPPGDSITKGVGPGSSSPLLPKGITQPVGIPVGHDINIPIMPKFPYQVQLQADLQTGLYRVVSVGLPAQEVSFHDSNRSPSGNSYSSPISKAGIPPQTPINSQESNLTNANNLHTFWTRPQDVLDTSSDGDSIFISMSPGRLRRAVIGRKRDEIKKRIEKSKLDTRLSKKYSTKIASSSLIRNSTDSESSESCALAKPKATMKSSHQIAKNKHAKGSYNDRDHQERLCEKTQKSKHFNAHSNNTFCNRFKGRPEIRKSEAPPKADASEKSRKVCGVVSEDQQERTRSEVNDANNSCPVEFILAATSPASVSSVSRDSGVNMRFSVSSGEDLSQVTEAQFADALQGHSIVKRVIRLIRHAFAFDGYLENGVEDRQMAEYIASLAKLSWMTFSCAVTEKFCDLYWDEELLEKLYEAINGLKPNPTQPTERPVAANPKISREAKPYSTSSKSHSATTKSQKTKCRHTKSQKTKSSAYSKHPQEDKVVLDLLSNAFVKSTSSSHSCTVKLSDADAKFSRKYKNISSATDCVRIKSSSSDKIGSVIRKESRTTPEVHSEEVHRTKDMQHLREKEDSGSSGKRTAQTKGHLAGGNLVAKMSNRNHDEKGNETKVPSGHTASTKAETMLKLSEKNIKQHTRQEPVMREKERTDNQTNDTFYSNKDILLTGLPDENQTTNTSVSSTKVSNKDLLLSNSATKSQSISSSLGNPQINAINRSNSKDSFKMNQSQASLVSIQSSSSYVFRPKSLNKSMSSCEAPVGRSKPSATIHKNQISSSKQHLLNSDSSDSNSHATMEKISNLLQNALSRNDSVLSFSSTSSSGTFQFLKTSVDNSSQSVSDSFTDDGCKGRVDPKSSAYTRQFIGAGDTQNSIESKIADVEQQLMLEKRMKIKTDKFYNKLVDAQQNQGADHRTMLVKVGKQLTEMSIKIEFLESAKMHLGILYAEQWGLDLCLLYNFATIEGTKPLRLKPSTDNPLLAFDIGKNKQSLQAGKPLGLFSFLYARQALLDGYLHHFFYTYHYFATAEELLQFLQEKFCAATCTYASDQQENRIKILRRTVDILQVWIEGFYEADFRPNPVILEQIIIFITEKVLPVDPQGQCLLELLDQYQRETPAMRRWQSVTRQQSAVPTKTIPLKQSSSFSSPKHLLHHDKSRLKMGIVTCFTKKKDLVEQDNAFTYLPSPSLDKKGFSLSEHTSVTVAQELTIMQQELFRKIHPVRYLNSRFKGIGVSANNNSSTRTQGSISMMHNGSAEIGTGVGDLSEKSLFLESLTEDDNMITVLLEHATNISHWVSAEIVTSSSSKIQVALLSKFINISKACYDIRNFATCVQIMDGLENLIVRQVPAWRNLPSKVVSIYEDLCAARALLQGDSDNLVEGGNQHKQSTLPPTLLFLIHVQQLEIGGFQLANGMVRWAKIKSIAKLIDNIRLFQDHCYSFGSDTTLQGLLKQRVADFNKDDIQVLAARNSSNFHQLSSGKSGGKRLRNTFQRVKANLQH